MGVATRPMKKIQTGAGSTLQGINPNMVAPFEIGIAPTPHIDPIGELTKRLQASKKGKPKPKPKPGPRYELRAPATESASAPRRTARPSVAAEPVESVATSPTVDDTAAIALHQRVKRFGLIPWRNSLPFCGFPRFSRLTDAGRRGMTERWAEMCTVELCVHIGSQIAAKSGALSQLNHARAVSTALAWLCWHSMEYDLEFAERQ